MLGNSDVIWVTTVKRPETRVKLCCLEVPLWCLDCGKMWSFVLYRLYEPGVYLPPLVFLLLPTHHPIPTHPAVIVHELVCAGHSTVMLAQHIKELPPSSRPSRAPQHASAGPGDGAFVCFIGFVWILQSVSNSGRKCRALGLLLYCMHVRLKCRETRRTSTETRLSRCPLQQHNRRR